MPVYPARDPAPKDSDLSILFIYLYLSSNGHNVRFTLGMFEKILLVVLIAASAYGFWYRFRNVVRVLGAAKPDPDFHLGSLVPRARTFVWEVLLQGKVIKQ